MTPQKIPAPETVSWQDLRTLAGAASPCISVAVAIPDPLQIRTLIKNAIRDLEKKLREARIDASTSDVLTGPIHALAASAAAEGVWAHELLLYSSPDMFRQFSSFETGREFVAVGQSFEVRPLLSLFTREQRFYVLALSQKHVRLFRSTHHTFEELDLQGMAPQSLDAWMNTKAPDHVLDNRSSAGRSVGGMKGVMFGTNTDRERRYEYLAHFFKAIDTGLRRSGVDRTVPMMLAGVEEEITIYRRENTYPRLFAETVHGSPDGLPPAEIHKRALGIVRKTFSAELEKVLEAYAENRGNSRVALGLDGVLKAAYEGRVSALLLRDDAERHGAWDRAMEEIGPGDDDLFNLAALAVVSHGGQAYSLKMPEMPDQADAAAVLRY